MILNFVLIAVFLTSISVLWYRLSQKIPELVAVPDDIIHEYIHGEIARRRSMIVSLIKAWYGNKSIQEIVLHSCGKVLYKFHIALLKADNAVVLVLKKVRVNGSAAASSSGNNGNGATAERSETYWKDLKGDRDQENVSPHMPRNIRIEEVRMKKEQ